MSANNLHTFFNTCLLGTTRHVGEDSCPPFFSVPHCFSKSRDQEEKGQVGGQRCAPPQAVGLADHMNGTALSFKHFESYYLWSAVLACCATDAL